MDNNSFGKSSNDSDSSDSISNRKRKLSRSIADLPPEHYPNVEDFPNLAALQNFEDIPSFDNPHTFEDLHTFKDEADTDQNL